MGKNDDITALLQPGTVAEAEAATARLLDQAEALHADIEQLSEQADHIHLHHGEAAYQKHIETIRSKEREARRIGLAMEKLEERLSDLKRAEVLTRAEADLERAKQIAAEAMKAHVRVSELFREAAEYIDSLADFDNQLATLRESVESAGLTFTPQMPHAALFEPEEWESRTVTVHHRGPSVIDPTTGRDISRPQGVPPERSVTRRTERVQISKGRKVPDLTRVRMALPDPMDSRNWIILRDGH